MERPLSGVRVLELGQLLAGPWCGTILGYWGAEVIKVEPPGTGDPIRHWRLLDDDGTSVWWRSIGRNKRSVTIDLREADGRTLVRSLARRHDVLIENFKPGTMEKWGLGPDVLLSDNPGLIYVRVSGFGQTGPYASRPGFAAVCEAVGGLRYLNGVPGEAPVRPNLSLGDTLGGLHAALGTLLALRARDRSSERRGQVVDVALAESVFAVLESVIPEFDRFGAVRQPSGTTITGVVPTNTYPTRSGSWVVIGANADSMFKRLMRAVDRPDLAEDPRLGTNPGRVRHAAEIDEAIATWTRAREAAEIVGALEAAGVPAGAIYSAEDLARDPHFRARGMFERVESNGRPLALPALVPKLERTPGQTRHAGPDLGADTDEVLRELCGLDDAGIAALRARGIV